MKNNNHTLSVDATVTNFQMVIPISFNSKRSARWKLFRNGFETAPLAQGTETENNARNTI